MTTELERVGLIILLIISLAAIVDVVVMAIRLKRLRRTALLLFQESFAGELLSCLLLQDVVGAMPGLLLSVVAGLFRLELARVQVVVHRVDWRHTRL